MNNNHQFPGGSCHLLQGLSTPPPLLSVPAPLLPLPVLRTQFRPLNQTTSDKKVQRLHHWAVPGTEDSKTTEAVLNIAISTLPLGFSTLTLLTLGSDVWFFAERAVLWTVGRGVASLASTQQDAQDTTPHPSKLCQWQTFSDLPDVSCGGGGQPKLAWRRITACAWRMASEPQPQAACP